jgi:hypothetical protein
VTFSNFGRVQEPAKEQSTAKDAKGAKKTIKIEFAFSSYSATIFGKRPPIPIRVIRVNSRPDALDFGCGFVAPWGAFERRDRLLSAIIACST